MNPSMLQGGGERFERFEVSRDSLLLLPEEAPATCKTVPRPRGDTTPALRLNAFKFLRAG